MIKTKSLLILISTLLFSNYYLSFSEELTITTYYPSPVGIYKELRAKKMAIGDNYYNPSDYSWGSEISSDADLVVEGKVGIGVLKPEKELHVAGDTKIENDLNVDGDTQLGNASSDKTTVKGDLKVDGGVAVGDVTNMGPGTINAQKIYVKGTEIGGGGGGLSILGICMEGKRTVLHCYWDKGSCYLNKGTFRDYCNNPIGTAKCETYTGCHEACGTKTFSRCACDEGSLHCMEASGAYGAKIRICFCIGE